MAQDGSSQIDPQQEKELRGQVEEKLGKLSAEKVHWQVREDEREAKVRRQHALEQAAGVVKATMDWQDGTPTGQVAGRAALELADQFYRWVETGKLPQ